MKLAEEYLKIIFENNLQEKLLKVLKNMMAHYQRITTLDNCPFCRFDYLYSKIVRDNKEYLKKADGCSLCPYNLLETNCARNADGNNLIAASLRKDRPIKWRKKRIKQLWQSIKMVNEYAERRNK